MTTEALITAGADERIRKTSPLIKLLRRPEVGAAVAALAIFVFFSVSTQAFLTPAGVSTWLYSSCLLYTSPSPRDS